MNTTRVWLDTDPGSDIDDVLALAYLLRRPDCRLEGVSTVTGPVEDRARVAAAVASVAGRDDVPVYAGYGEPLSGPGQPACPQAAALTGPERERTFPPDPDGMAGAVARAARDRPGELTLLTIGPLTNAARLFRSDPELPSLLREMVLMAGHFHPPEPGAEWNALCDPEATRTVAEAPVRRRWYGLDVTLKCFLPAGEVRRRFRGPLLETVLRFAEVWFRRRDRITFHDPLAAACLFEPELCTYQTARIEVTTDGDHPGRTIPHPSDEAGADRVAREVDPEAFFRNFFSVVGEAGV